MKPLMPDKSVFTSLEPTAKVVVQVDGTSLSVNVDQSVAAALLAAGVTPFRTTPVNGAPRAPYCMMGACFECLLEVDGKQNQQSCRIAVREGMRINRQPGARSLGNHDDR